MRANGEPLNALQVGSYAELSGRPNQHQFIFQPVPPLAAILLSAENTKGRPLIQAEVYALRDNATAVTIPAELAKSTETERGYKDIAPSQARDEWHR